MYPKERGGKYALDARRSQDIKGVIKDTEGDMRARDKIKLAEEPRKDARRWKSGVNPIFADVIEGAGNVVTCQDIMHVTYTLDSMQLSD